MIEIKACVWTVTSGAPSDHLMYQVEQSTLDDGGLKLRGRYHCLLADTGTLTKFSRTGSTREFAEILQRPREPNRNI